MQRNVAADFFAAASGRLDDPFLIDADTTITYRTFYERVRQFAGALDTAGARPGDRVLVQVEKSPEAVALYLACLWAGAVHVPLNPTFTADERTYFIDDSRPAVVVVDPAVAVDATWLTLAADGTGTLVERAASATPRSKPMPRADDDLAAILYTSGTTGRPKGAALTHEGLRRNARALHDTWRFGPSDHLVHALPLFHVHGLFVALHCALLAAIPVTFLRRFDVDTVIDGFVNGTVFMGVPTHYARLCDSERLTPGACATMRLFTCGSAPLTET
ncbi:MAG: AMP-binding protein, partial [Actinomycetota bacterium]